MSFLFLLFRHKNHEYILLHLGNNLINLAAFPSYINFARESTTTTSLTLFSICNAKSVLIHSDPRIFLTPSRQIHAEMQRILCLARIDLILYYFTTFKLLCGSLCFVDFDYVSSLLFCFKMFLLQ